MPGEGARSVPRQLLGLDLALQRWRPRRVLLSFPLMAHSHVGIPTLLSDNSSSALATQCLFSPRVSPQNAADSSLIIQPSVPVRWTSGAGLFFLCVDVPPPPPPPTPVSFSPETSSKIKHTGDADDVDTQHTQEPRPKATLQMAHVLRLFG